MLDILGGRLVGRLGEDILERLEVGDDLPLDFLVSIFDIGKFLEERWTD